MSDAVDRLFLCQLKCHVAWPALSHPYNCTSGVSDLFNRHWDSIRGVKRPGPESGHLRPSSAEADRRQNYITFHKKVEINATVCRHLFTAKSLYMFRVSQHPSSGALKTVTATSGIGYNTGTATSFHRGLIRTLVLIRPRWKEVALPVL